MVRYITMKRITQILASVLFVITVVTVYLVFDFAISNATPNKTSSSMKRSHHHHHHSHSDDEVKVTQKRSITVTVLHPIKKSNGTNKHHEDHDGRQSRSIKPPSRAKAGNFQKGKTGVKINKLEKFAKEQRKRLSTSAIPSQHRDKRQFDNKHHHV